MNRQHHGVHLAVAALALALAGAGISGCTTTGPSAKADYATASDQIEANADATLSRLYQAAPASRQLVDQAAGVLIFPSVLSVGLVVGGEHGKGVLRVGGRTVEQYSHSGGSIGLQAGAQTRAEVVLFMTPDSLAKFRASKGWTAGADATIAVAHIGANGMIDTETGKAPIVGFVLNNTGLMAGVSLQGAKYSRIS
ncbi:MAG: BPSL1445 family SYLF domain-containing lipoprotein [Usitatibacter sp.]